MPKMSLDDLKSSFSIEADKYFPFAQDQIYTDCCILDMNEKEKTMSVMAAATKKELIDRRTKLLSELGMPVEFIGLNPIALANILNVLNLENEDDEKTKGNEHKEGKSKAKSSVIALLDMGESVSSLTILVNNLPRFTRDIFIGGRDFTKSISSALGASFKEAEELKRNPGKKINEIHGACETIIMNMTQELRLSMDYFATEKNHEIDKLLLTGGTSLLEGLVESFEKNLELEVSLWNPLSALQMSPDVSKENMDKNALKLGVALGLALYHYD
jgi:type IV pilus assembly protein PilM